MNQLKEMEPYRNDLEHLRDELRRIDLYVGRAVRESRARRAGTGEFRGLYVSDEEVDALLSAEPGERAVAGWAEVEGEAAALRDEIRRRADEGRRAGFRPRLPHLCATFNLNPFEADLLLLAFAAEFDARHRKLFAYLQDDVARPVPTVELALSLLCVNALERARARECLREDAPLIAHALVALGGETAASSLAASSLAERTLKIDGRVFDFLCGGDRLDARLAGAARWVLPSAARRELHAPEETEKILARIVPLVGGREGWRCVLRGPGGVGKKTFAAAACREAGRALLVVDLPALFKEPPAHAAPFAAISQTSLLRAALREASLYGAAVYLDGLAGLPADGASAQTLAREVEREIENFGGFVFLGCGAAWQPALARPGRVLAIKLAAPDTITRRKIWESRLGAAAVASPEIDTSHLAGAFRFTAGEIKSAHARARAVALLRGGDPERPTAEDLLAGCRAQSTQRISALATKITPRRGWDDLVLPRDTVAQLREFCQQVRRRARVHDEWGFGRRHALGRGATALLTGPSGTGKSLSAEVIAGDLGLDLYRVDLSCVVSKYIGETEKNLSRVFDDAQVSNAVLFFDEADALWGKRSETKDAHDRYANIEVSYLLQRVEDYEGVCILASNFGKNIDAAFIRRMRFCVELPFPDEAHRLRIWRGVFPEQAPLDSDVDFNFLAHKFKLAGGNIKNVALAAAFNAASNGGTIKMEHVVLALKREYQKLGRACERSEFGGFYELVR